MADRSVKPNQLREEKRDLAIREAKTSTATVLLKESVGFARRKAIQY